MDLPQLPADTFPSKAVKYANISTRAKSSFTRNDNWWINPECVPQASELCLKLST